MHFLLYKVVGLLTWCVAIENIDAEKLSLYVFYYWLFICFSIDVWGVCTVGVSIAYVKSIAKSLF